MDAMYTEWVSSASVIMLMLVFWAAEPEAEQEKGSPGNARAGGCNSCLTSIVFLSKGRDLVCLQYSIIEDIAVGERGRAPKDSSMGPTEVILRT
ncbi:hypothetical protein BJV78DRAFT_1256318 [Lactifluus subvellereus]|nr:hypothetical protein BJV78DRAFT_1256318 [Lactifluus subvellereus]